MPFERTRESHESFAMVQISRVQCTPAMTVFGSSVKTSSPVCLRINTADMERGLNRNWYYSQNRLIEICMSPSQFADMITNLNTSGTPCSLTWFGGKSIEECPSVDQRQLFEQEFEKKTMDVSEALRELKKKASEILESSGPVKVADKKALMNKITMIEQEVRSNMPFVHTQFTRAMDKTVSAAKAEVEAHISSSLERLGKQAIAADGIDDQKHLLEFGG